MACKAAVFEEPARKLPESASKFMRAATMQDLGIHSIASAHEEPAQMACFAGERAFAGCGQSAPQKIKKAAADATTLPG